MKKVVRVTAWVDPRDGRPALPRPAEKQAAPPRPAPQKAVRAPPREIDKTRGAKLTADASNGPFSLRLQIMH